MTLNLALAIIGGLTLLLSLLAGFTKRKLYLISEPMIATIVGVLIGPLVLDLLNLANWGDTASILEQAARLTVGFSVMGIALRLPKHYFKKHWSSMLSILGLGMLGMWLISGLLTWWLLGVLFWVALLIGAIVTPTDPVLSGTIVTGEVAQKNIPARLRQILSAEAGANDGGAYPFVFLCLYMVTTPPEGVWSKWFVDVVLWGVLAAVVIGGLIGYLAARLQKWSNEKDFLEKTSILTITVALTITVLGLVKLFGSDGILAVFVAGLVFNSNTEEEPERKETNIQEAIKRLFTFPVFVFFGMMLPWHEWVELGSSGILLAAFILLLRRLPVMYAISRFIIPLKNKPDIAFNGWFGPIGVAALYYAMLAEYQTHNVQVWIVASLIITASVVAHGVTSTPFTKLYGRISE